MNNIWKPFNSVVSTKDMCTDIINNKNIIEMPSLSNDQLNDIENKIFTSYYSKCNLEILYYYMGKIYKIISLIKYIDKIKMQIILGNGKILYFKQIVNVKII